jgi:L-threonylcarbamoyladenylate synthase
MAGVSAMFDCSDPTERSEGLARAQRALASQQCVVIPTDTVYGIAADAFAPQAVAALLAAKGRGRSMPPPVLIPRAQTLDGLAVNVSLEARRLAEEFWPGGLTLICHAQPSLSWDLGDTFGTVALRMPDDRVALDLLILTGPLAVSSANRTGQPAAATAAEAYEQLGDAVEVYLEDGPRSADAGASTIVDTTGDLPIVVREGVISFEELRAVVPGVVLAADTPAPGTADGDAATGTAASSGNPATGNPASGDPASGDLASGNPEAGSPEDITPARNPSAGAGRADGHLPPQGSN